MCINPSFSRRRESSKAIAPQSGQYQSAVSLREVYPIHWIPACAGMTRQCGISLIELIMFIVIVSIALTGIMLGMNQITGHSADTMLRKQALTAAESLLEEIEARDFSPTSAHAAVTTANRATVYHIVSDYDGFATTGIYAIDGTPVTGLNNYSLATTVAPTAFGNIPSASSVLITVTVTGPIGEAIVASGYRTNH